MSRKPNLKSLTANNGRPAAIIKPQLTSLIDVMTILLVFLLKSFSNDGHFVNISPDLTLAESESKTRPIESLNIELTPEYLIVDGMRVGTLENVAISDTMMIGGLYHKLIETLKSPRMAVHKGRIIIQCDKSVDFKILKKVMYTCGKANFSHFSLLVVGKV